MPTNQITGPNAGGPRQLAIRTPLAARVGQFCRWPSIAAVDPTCRGYILAPWTTVESSHLSPENVGENPAFVGSASRFPMFWTIWRLE